MKVKMMFICRYQISSRYAHYFLRKLALTYGQTNRQTHVWFYKEYSFFLLRFGTLKMPSIVLFLICFCACASIIPKSITVQILSINLKKIDFDKNKDRLTSWQTHILKDRRTENRQTERETDVLTWQNYKGS